MVTDEKGQTKNMYMKRNQKSNHCAKNVLQCRILKASKTDVNGAKVQTTAKYIQFDAWLEQVPTGVMQKQANQYISGTNFILIKTEYFQLFMGFKNQKQKHVFPKTLNVKTLFPS